MSKEVKKKIVKTVIWSVALYSAETWSLRKEDIRRIEALEMWIWRRIERISWTEKITNCRLTDMEAHLHVQVYRLRCKRQD